MQLPRAHELLRWFHFVSCLVTKPKYAHRVFQNSLFLGISKRVVVFFRRFSFPYGFETALSIDKVALVAVVCLAK